jgi:dimethylargininase
MDRSFQKKAITRQVSPAIEQCELTHLPRSPIDFELARHQHAAYEQVLQQVGCQVISLPADPDLPDSVFVEDVAVVLPELAVITRPGAASRRAECATVKSLLSDYRSLAEIAAPGTLDGGDVLCVGRTLYTGLSSRSSQEGLSQLAGYVEPFGFRVVPVEVSGCLHLKSAVTQVADDALLVNPEWVDGRLFGVNAHCIEIDPAEPLAANALRIGEALIYPASFPRTLRRLELCGFRVHVLDVSELQKAEGAVTCCSLVFD